MGFTHAIIICSFLSIVGIFAAEQSLTIKNFDNSEASHEHLSKLPLPYANDEEFKRLNPEVDPKNLKNERNKVSIPPDAFQNNYQKVDWKSLSKRLTSVVLPKGMHEIELQRLLEDYSKDSIRNLDPDFIKTSLESDEKRSLDDSYVNRLNTDSEAWKERAFMVDYILRLCHEDYFHPQVCVTAVNIYDRFLSKSSTVTFPLNIIAATCFQLATSMEYRDLQINIFEMVKNVNKEYPDYMNVEEYPVYAKNLPAMDLHYLKSCRRIIVQTLKYDLFTSSPYSVIEVIMHYLFPNNEILRDADREYALACATFFFNSALMEPDSLNHSNTLLAVSSCFVTAQYVLDRSFHWDDRLTALIPFSQSKIDQAVFSILYVHTRHDLPEYCIAITGSFKHDFGKNEYAWIKKFIRDYYK